ncbi:alpha-L-rhamnosidase-related protein [Duganella radicis]|uniref:Bacterial alpha-L-rhamnosidase n=1 Tax=Duganella radicis TaxID=551988 RepID=A0A6L6PGL5_9BURK|nr:amylo-alpha-1,6-glucosidase [Duganella radicis]MTV37731.1 Bacterial alpha-L-rhamnosidase [Duganella radicis]
MRPHSFFVGILLALALACGGPASAQDAATWIWYPGDFEIWLSNRMQVQRVERAVAWPPFWRLYHHQPQMNFTRQLELAEPEEITLAVEGTYNVAIDGKFVHGDQQRITLPAGKHGINIQVYNPVSPPSVYVRGRTVHSDATWTVAPRPFQAVAEGAVAAASWNLSAAGQPPSRYKLATTEVKPAAIQRGPHSVLVDFGQETIGFIKLSKLKGNGKLSLYYGESPEEALSTGTCETLDHYTINANDGDFIAGASRALRYVNIEFDPGVGFDEVSLLYEYLPVTPRGTFRSSDDQLNRIWDVAMRTLELNTREFFIDGIKRDHWVWSGDAVQAYLMNYYAFFDSDTVKRTTWALRGADPVDMHLNTILDYSLYWFIGIRDYYQYTGDAAFVKSIYPRMVSLMNFVLARGNANGMLEGLPGDWVFVDWADMPKDGELSTIQLLLARSLEAMADCAALARDEAHAAAYRQMATALRHKIMATFWDTQRQVFVHARKDGRLNRLVTRHPAMFALMFGYLDDAQAAAVRRNVLMNDTVQKITTPYMRFYELAALAESGRHDYVTAQIKDYWGGMLRDGATCFWEQYDPKVKGPERYAMYGKPFGMSLCHAWGASPLYLLGKYYLGVKPTQPGYAAYIVEPKLGGLRWIEGKVPTPRGDIAVFASATQIKVTAADGQGLLRFTSATPPRSGRGALRKIADHQYELTLESGKTYTVERSN